MVKKCTILVVLVLLLMPLAIVQADSTHCGDLSDADCQIILNNIAVMNEVNSFAFDMDMSFDAGGDAIDESMRLAGQAGGAVSMAEEALLEIEALSEDMSESDDAALLELLLTGLTADIWLNLNMSSASEDSTMELSLRMKEGVVLIGAGAMAELTGQEMTGLEWFGLDLTGGIEDLLSEAGIMPESDSTPMHSDEMEAAEAAATMITRLPDSEVNGVAVAVFETNIDINEIMSMITIEDIVAEAGEGQDPEMALDIMQHMTINELVSRQYIGLINYYTYGLDVALDLVIDGEFMDSPGASVTITLDVDIEMSDFNEPVEVEIPEDAMIFPLAMMMQMNN